MHISHLRRYLGQRISSVEYYLREVSDMPFAHDREPTVSCFLFPVEPTADSMLVSDMTSFPAGPTMPFASRSICQC